MNIPEQWIKRLLSWPFGISQAVRRATLAEQESIEVSKSVLRDCPPDTCNARVVINFSLYVAIFDRDLLCILKQLWLTRDSWGRNLLARQLALLIVEGLEDLAQLNGQCIRLTNSEHEDIRSGFLTTSRSISDFRRTHEQKLRDVRITAVAHRDKNADALITSIEELDVRKVESLGWDLVEAMADTTSACLPFMKSACKICREKDETKSTTHK